MYLFMYWFIYSFFGFIIETIYTSVPARKFQDRGFLSSPIIPIYGFGAMSVILILAPYTKNIILLFVLSFFLTSVLEYITSYVMEKLFHMRWWDYSERKFNIKGRVCLRNSLMFGGLSVILIELIHPYIISIMNLFSRSYLSRLSSIFAVIILIDFTHAVYKSAKYTQISIDINRLKLRYNDRKEDIESLINKLQVRINNLNHRLIKRYPILKEQLLSRLEELRNLRK